MTSVANPKVSPSVLSTNSNSTKNSSPASMAKVVNNNASRPSNGNTSMENIAKKKEFAQNSSVKRKSRVLSSSDESDDDNQSLVSLKTKSNP